MGHTGQILNTDLIQSENSLCWPGDSSFPAKEKERINQKMTSNLEKIKLFKTKVVICVALIWAFRYPKSRRQ